MAALLLVIALGMAFEALLAHELMKRSHRWAVQVQPAQETFQRMPGEEGCPARPYWDPHHGDPHHGRRERLTVGTTTAPCLPSARSI
jgi:hypothetical protein